MEIKIQRCQNCGSRDLRNILVRDESQKVIVQCRNCDALVARYILSTGGYYHAGKDFESFLRSIERDGGASSARDLHTEFDEVKHTVEGEFDQVQAELNERYDGEVP